MGSSCSSTNVWRKRPPTAFSRLLKKSDSCFDRLSTNGKSPTTSSLPPFALSLSKGERRVFQHPVKALHSLQSLMVGEASLIDGAALGPLEHELAEPRAGVDRERPAGEVGHL